MKTFLPYKDPLKEYKSSSTSLNRLADIADQLPKLLLTNNVQKIINSLNTNDLSVGLLIKNKNIRELKLAMVQLSFISHAYIWGAKTPSKILPEAIAKPWAQVANIGGLPNIFATWVQGLASTSGKTFEGVSAPHMYACEIKLN